MASGTDDNVRGDPSKLGFCGISIGPDDIFRVRAFRIAGLMLLLVLLWRGMLFIAGGVASPFSIGTDLIFNALRYLTRHFCSLFSDKKAVFGIDRLRINGGAIIL